MLSGYNYETTLAIFSAFVPASKGFPYQAGISVLWVAKKNRMNCHWRVVKATTSFHLIVHASWKGAIRVLLSNTEKNITLSGALFGTEDIQNELV